MVSHLHSLAEANLEKASVVTIGVFDGVHRGHQHLVRQLVDFATDQRQASCVLTFYPYPDTVLRGLRKGYYLTLPDVKANLLGELGVEVVVTHPFDDNVRHIRAQTFVEKLLSSLNMKSLWVGADFAMGYEREGNVHFLREASKHHDFDLRVIDLMDAGNEHVSSSRIRNALAAGDVEEAARLLGRPHRVPGTVVLGAGRGKAIGIPTANLSFPEEQAIPRQGVYAAWANTELGRVPAVVNIGVRPTFDGSGNVTVEAHLLDFDMNLYGQELNLDFVAHLRDERRFEGVSTLVAQIEMDIQQARQLLIGYE